MVEINKEIPLTSAEPVALDVVDKSSGENISINAESVTSDVVDKSSGENTSINAEPVTLDVVDKSSGEIISINAEPVTLDVVDKSSGEIISINATPVTIVPMVKFKTNFTDNTVTNDAEYNNKPYEIDDSMYVPLKDLLKMAERQKVPLKLVDTFDGLSDEEVVQAINQDEESVSVVSSNDDISGDVSIVKNEETLNPEISEPDTGTVNGEE